MRGVCLIYHIELKLHIYLLQAINKGTKWVSV